MRRPRVCFVRPESLTTQVARKQEAYQIWYRYIFPNKLCCETSRSSIRQSICMASFKHTECNTRHRGHHSLSSNPSDPPNLTKQIRLLAVRKQSRSLARLRAASDSGTKQKVAESKQSSESTKGGMLFNNCLLTPPCKKGVCLCKKASRFSRLC